MKERSESDRRKRNQNTSKTPGLCYPKFEELMIISPIFSIFHMLVVGLPRQMGGGVNDYKWFFSMHSLSPKEINHQKRNYLKNFDACIFLGSRGPVPRETGGREAPASTTSKKNIVINEIFFNCWRSVWDWFLYRSDIRSNQNILCIMNITVVPEPDRFSDTGLAGSGFWKELWSGAGLFTCVV